MKFEISQQTHIKYQTDAFDVIINIYIIINQFYRSYNIN